MARRGAGGTALPSGDAGPNDGTYRRLFDYSEELQQLAEDNPKLVKYFELKKETYSDRPVESITVGKNVDEEGRAPCLPPHGRASRPRVAVGRAHDGVRLRAHQRLQERQQADQEAPARRRGSSSSRSSTRTASTPRARPGETGGAAGGRPAPGGRRDREPRDPLRVPAKELPRGPAIRAAHGATAWARRTSASPSSASTRTATTAASGAARAHRPRTRCPYGSTAQDYRGPGPFSEPETQNIRKLVSKDQVVTLHHQPHVLEPAPAPAGPPGQGPAAGREGLQGLRRVDGQGERLHEPEELRALRHERRRPRTGPTTPPAASASRSRSASLRVPRRRSRTASSPSTTAPARPRATAAATASPT